VCVSGIREMRTFWSMELYHTSETETHDFFEAQRNLFQFGIIPNTQVRMIDGLDFSTEQTQLS